MAIFGAQLVFTMIMACIFSKISPFYSFAKWLLCKTSLKYYLHPSDEDLKMIAGISKSSKNKNKVNQRNGRKRSTGSTENEENSTFNIPKNVEINLETSEINSHDVVSLRFYPDYQWLIDFSICSAFVYIISEIYIYLFPLRNEANLSMLWCLLVFAFCIKILMSLTTLLFYGNENSGEKSVLICSFFLYLLIALFVLILSEEQLDLGLDSAYDSFNRSSTAFLNAQGLNSSGVLSKSTFKAVIAVLCAFIGAFFTFPGLRLGKMHQDAVRLSKGKPFNHILLHVSFLMPLFISLLWVQPIGRRYLTQTVFSGHSRPLMTESQFDIMRLILVVSFSLLRIGMMPAYLQSYLNMAADRIRDLKKETGKISNTQFKYTIASVFYYLCVVALQYVAPVIMSIFLALLCKTLGGYQWQDLYMSIPRAEFCEKDTCSSSTSHLYATSEAAVPVFSTLPHIAIDSENLRETTKNLSLGLEEIKKIFTFEFHRGIFGFLTWWCVFVNFLSSTFGVLYQSYFSKA